MQCAALQGVVFSTVSASFMITQTSETQNAQNAHQKRTPELFLAPSLSQNWHNPPGYNPCQNIAEIKLLRWRCED
jgi:hypothetical protein